MKRYLLLVTTIFFSLTMMAIDVKNIYIAGDAMPCGWTDSNPESMTVLDTQKGVFSWTGKVNVGEFKFLLERGKWTNCLNASTEKEGIVVGNQHTLVHVPYYYREGNDYSFQFTEEGTYTITVYAREMLMVVKKTESISIPTDLWATGSAIPNGIAKLTEAPTLAEGYFRYYGKLQSGEFKIK